MNMRRIFTRLAVFVFTGTAAFIALQALGHATEASEALRTEISQQLQALLSAAVGGVLALLMPRFPPIVSPVSPPPPPPPVSLDEYKKVCAELNQWRAYGAKADPCIRSLKEARSLLDTRQAVLRTSMYGMVCLAFFVCVAGFVAPDIAAQLQDPHVAVPPETFFRHLGYLLIPFAGIGLTWGGIVFRIRVHTTAYNAVRCALIAAAIVGLVSTLVPLPYVYRFMAQQHLKAVWIEMPVLGWLVLFRLIAAPFLCAVCAYAGFHVARVFSRGATPSPSTPR